MINLNCLKALLLVIGLAPAVGLQAGSAPPLVIVPVTTPFIQMPNNGNTTVDYKIINQTKKPQLFTVIGAPINGVTQNSFALDHCMNPFLLQPSGSLGSSCTLSLNIDRNQFRANGGPVVGIYPGIEPFMQPNPTQVLQSTQLDPNFPYGSPPKGNVCLGNSGLFATPESMLGSWAMQQAVAMDSIGHVLPSFMTPTNVVYGVGTAAIGQKLGLASCDGGCDALNGYCFAIKFNEKPSNYPYMIFQSTNIGAATNTFDIYMAGGGSGAFPQFCAQFFGTQNDSNVDFSNHIEDPIFQNTASPCGKYFNDFSSINSTYLVNYQGTHTAKSTLMQACIFASAPSKGGTSGFNTQNFQNISVIPVTCPRSLTQITGIELAASVMTVGNQAIRPLSTLTDNDFNSGLSGITTTQMQDCKTPSSGFCSKDISKFVPPYLASISASLTGPILTPTS